MGQSPLFKSLMIFFAWQLFCVLQIEKVLWRVVRKYFRSLKDASGGGPQAFPEFKKCFGGWCASISGGQKMLREVVRKHFQRSENASGGAAYVL